MAQTKPKAAQFYGVSDNGTDGQFLKTDGTGGMSWDSPITNPTITSIDYPGTQTAADPAGGESVIINGTLFASGITCTVDGTSAVTAFNSATQITITTPAKAAGQYTIAVTNLNGGTASQANFIQYSGLPVWSTASGSLGSVQEGDSASFQVTATEGSDTIEYAVTTGTLPTGLSLNTNTGAITGTAPSVSADTTTTFSITATDDENQTSSERSFSITVTNDLPSNHFNTVLYTGTGSSQSITNVGFAPDFVWIKDRDAANWHNLQDTIRGATKHLYSNASNAQDTTSDGLTSFNSNGFTIGGGGGFGNSGNNFVAWSFKAGGAPTATNSAGAGNAPTLGSVMIDGVASTAALAGTTAATKISANTKAGFSIVQFSGNLLSAGNIQVGHGLNSAPELIIQKNIQATGTWWARPFFLNNNPYQYLGLSESASLATSSSSDGTMAVPTSTTFDNNWNTSLGGTNGVPVIAYCFHSVAGFSKIGSYTGSGAAGKMIQTGFKPAFLMIKRTNGTSDWNMWDDKRGDGSILWANGSNAEASSTNYQIDFLSNGFVLQFYGNFANGSGDSYIYLAIAADGSTTTPSLANSFDAQTYSGTGSARSITGLGFKPDLLWWKARNSSSYNWKAVDSINGPTKNLYQNLTNTLASDVATTSFDSDGFTFGSGGNGNVSGLNYVNYAWKAGGTPSINTDGTIISLVSANQAAGFSIVKYTGNSTAGATVGHGLSTAPQLIIVKLLGGISAKAWTVYSETLGNTNYLYLNEDYQSQNNVDFWNNTSPVSDKFTVSSDTNVNSSSGSYIAYCFTSIAGYSKVGSYTGNGTAGHAISVGFTPSYVLIKRTNNTGNWYIFDSARKTGVYSDQLEVNTSGAENTGTYVELTSTGFSLNTTASNLNESGDTFIYLAIKEN